MVARTKVGAKRKREYLAVLEKAASKKDRSSMAAKVAAIRAELKHMTMQWSPRFWLNTQFPDLNEVLGSREKGIPYGRIMEISGWESQGKTALALVLAALAQRDGANIVWVDFETSFDPDWAAVRGVDCSKIVLLQPYVGRFEKERNPRLCSAEELCAEAEGAMRLFSGPRKKILVVIDSVPAMLPEGVAAAGLEGQSMRTRMDLPMFLSSLLQRWVGLAQSYNALVIFINQLRQSPQAFGDPTYTPGGNALRFYSHVRIRMRLVKGGKMTQGGKLIGIKGILRNKKNKIGGLQDSSVGFKMEFRGPVVFLPAKQVEKSENE